MAKTIRWGILGAGRVARDFAQGLRALPDAELAGVASRTLTTAQAFARQTPVGRVYQSYNELVNDPSIDVIYVATPHQRHSEDCILCLEHGKPVLCEKPFTVNAQQARQVIDLARRRRLFCMEAMWMRFFPVMHKVRELVQSGVVGEVRMLTADFGVANAYSPTSRFFDPAYAGGALLDRGVYPISLASMLFGEPNEVVGQAGLTPSGVDEHSAVLLSFPKGRMAVLASSLTGYTSNEATVIGTHGKLRIHAPFYCADRISLIRYTPSSADPARSAGMKQRLVAKARQSPLARTAFRVLKPLVRRDTRQFRLPIVGNGYNYEAAEVMRCLRMGELESPLMPLDETLQIMQTMDRVRAQWGLKYPGE